MLVVAFQTLTLPVVPLTDPVTISLKEKVPDPPEPADEMVTVGVSIYLFPPSVHLILGTVPAALITDTPVAVVTPTTWSI